MEVCSVGVGTLMMKQVELERAVYNVSVVLVSGFLF